MFHLLLTKLFLGDTVPFLFQDVFQFLQASQACSKGLPFHCSILSPSSESGDSLWVCYRKFGHTVPMWGNGTPVSRCSAIVHYACLHHHTDNIHEHSMLCKMVPQNYLSQWRKNIALDLNCSTRTIMLQWRNLSRRWHGLRGQTSLR